MNINNIRRNSFVETLWTAPRCRNKLPKEIEQVFVWSPPKRGNFGVQKPVRKPLSSSSLCLLNVKNGKTKEEATPAIVVQKCVGNLKKTCPWCKALRRGLKMGKIELTCHKDRISILPTELRSRILSFLPIEMAARASLLSKDWQEVWKFSNQLNISESGFLGIISHQDHMEQSFERFSALNLDSFSFCFSRATAEMYHDSVERLILLAINRSPKKFSLDFFNPNDLGRPSYLLPDQFYSQPLLETLALSNCAFFADEFVAFTSLKSLSLSNIDLAYENDVLEGILLRCVILDTLILQHVRLDFETTIDSPNLKFLTIEDCDILWFEFRTPNLVFFKYKGIVLQPWLVNETFVFKSDSLVKEVNLNFVGTSCVGRRHVGDIAYKLLADLQPKLRILSVCSFTLQVLSKGNRAAHGLNLGVTQLVIRTAFHDREIEGIIVLLRSCPNLEGLTLIIGEENICTTFLPPLHHISHALNFLCAQNTLKVVSVHGYKGTFMEDYFLKYFIKQGKVMQQLVVRGHSKRVHRKRAYRLKGVKKGSPNLRITVK